MKAIVCLIVLLSVLPPLHAADSLSVIITGSMRGRATGCGCKVGLIGGLPRRQTLLTEKFGSERDKTGGFPLGIDCGRMFDLNPEGGSYSSSCTLNGLSKQGLKAIGVTPRDLFYGTDFLRNIADSADVTLVSANLISGDTRDLLFDKWAVVDAKSAEGKTFRIAITSLIAYHPGQEYVAGLRSWMVAHPDSVLASLTDSAPSADLHFLTTDMKEDDLRTFLIGLDLFDFVLTSNRQVFTPSPFQVDSVIVVNPSNDGRTVDGLTFHIGDSSDDLADSFTWFSYPVGRELTEDPETLKWLNGCLGRQPME